MPRGDIRALGLCVQRPCDKSIYYIVNASTFGIFISGLCFRFSVKLEVQSLLAGVHSFSSKSVVVRHHLFSILSFFIQVNVILLQANDYSLNEVVRSRLLKF